MTVVESYLLEIVLLSFAALGLGLLLRFLKQPSVVAYILTGAILGPYGIGLIRDTAVVSHLGNIGVVLLLFFVGMSISVSQIIAKWRIAIVGTLMQVLISVGVVFILGQMLGWGIGQIVLMGFVISLSSTAVVVKILESRNETDTKIGQDALSILIVQDLAIIPMIIIVSLIGGGSVDSGEIFLQTLGCILAFGLIWWLAGKDSISLPLGKVKTDPELRVFAALAICFGISALAGLFHLSTALGAFIAGLFISSAKETQWVKESMDPFRVLFIAVFFMSIGMLIDPAFLMENLIDVFSLLFLVFFINSIVNAAVFRWNGESWRNSLYGGSLLSQIGEFSFILAAVGLNAVIISEFSYQVIVEVIALSLIVSPLWIRFFSRFVDRSKMLMARGNVIRRGIRNVGEAAGRIVKRKKKALPDLK